MIAFRHAAEAAEKSGDQRLCIMTRGNYGYALCELGDLENAERVLRDVMAAAERRGVAFHRNIARQNLGLTLMRAGHTDEAIRVMRVAISEFVTMADTRLEGGSRIYLSLAFLQAGALVEAEHEARLAIELLARVPPLQPIALSVFARICVARGKAADAVAPARQAHDFIEKGGRVEEGEALIRLAWVEALAANGLDDEARVALARAKQRLRERATLITDEALRRGFLEGVPENAKTLKMT